MSTPSEVPKSNVPENEIRISGQTPVLRGVSRVEEAFKKFDNVTLTGINSGISKVLLITEIIKLKVPNLHQYNLIETIKTERHEENEENKSDDNPRFSTRFKVELHKKQLSTPPKNSFYEAPYTEDEVKKIYDRGLTEENISMQGIGYKEILEYIKGNVTKEEAIYNLRLNTRHFAKRQLTWFRHEKDAVMISKDEFKDDDEILLFMEKQLRLKGIID